MMTVGELVRHLVEMPDYWPVDVEIEGGSDGDGGSVRVPAYEVFQTDREVVLRG